MGPGLVVAGIGQLGNIGAHLRSDFWPPFSSIDPYQLLKGHCQFGSLFARTKCFPYHGKTLQGALDTRRCM
jgi:hypothetical protein